MADLEQIGLDAVDRFIATWNGRDPGAWAGSLNFPHVRPSPFGAIRVSPSAEAYASAVDYSRVISTGWDHSEWDYTQTIHTSPRKIHVAGQWTRYNSDGDKILTTPITYIVTRVDGKWGVQSRFGSDHAGDEDTSGFESRVFKHIESFVTHYNNGNVETCAALLNYPHFGVGIGHLDETTDASAFALTDDQIRIDQLMAIQTGLHSANVALDLTLIRKAEGHTLNAVLSVTNRNDHLGIQAWSLLDPNAEDEG